MSWQDRYSFTRIYLIKHSLTKRFINWRMSVREVTTITKCQGQISIVHCVMEEKLYYFSCYIFSTFKLYWEEITDWFLFIFNQLTKPFTKLLVHFSKRNAIHLGVLQLEKLLLLLVSIYLLFDFDFCPGNDTKLCPVMRLQFCSSAESRVSIKHR